MAVVGHRAAGQSRSTPAIQRREPSGIRSCSAIRWTPDQSSSAETARLRLVSTGGVPRVVQPTADRHARRVAFARHVVLGQNRALDEHRRVDSRFPGAGAGVEDPQSCARRARRSNAGDGRRANCPGVPPDMRSSRVADLPGVVPPLDPNAHALQGLLDLGGNATGVGPTGRDGHECRVGVYIVVSDRAG